MFAQPRDRRARRRDSAFRAPGPGVMFALIGALVVSSCASTVRVDTGGDSVDTAGVTPPGVGQSSVTPVPDPTQRPIIAYDVAVDSYLVDIEAFWGQRLADVFDVDFIPVERLVPFEPDRSDTLPTCGGELGPAALYRDNAFYCEFDDYIAWDASTLFPSLYDDFGDFALGLVLAHEYGHAVQARASLSGADLLMELQSDCFAGAWAATLVGTDSPLALSIADLDVAVAGFLKFADDGSTPGATEEAHGSAFDRIHAFQDGVGGGVEACAPYLDRPPRLTDLRPARGQGDDLAIDVLLPLMVDDVELLMSILAAEMDVALLHMPAGLVVRDGGVPALESCTEVDDSPGAALAAFYCASNDTVYADADALDDLLHRAGDFGASYQILHAWATATMLQIDGQRDSKAAVLAADCIAGVWSRHWFDQADGAAPEGELELYLSPGDLDEAVVAMLLARPVGSAGEVVPDLGAFERIAALSEGFFDGPARCRLTS